MIVENNFLKKFGNNLNENVKLSNYSWFNLGGNADYFFKANDKNHLKEFLQEADKQKLRVTILGAGSNTLFRDNGGRGAVIKLGREFSFINKIDDNIIEVGAATLDRKVANFAKDNNLENLEFLSCIPGSIGGAVIMNSGCYDNDMSKIIISINVLDRKKMTEKEIKKENIKFFYRGTDLSNDFIILSAKLKCSLGKKNEIEKKQNELIERKKLSQPSQIKTCGSTFKNFSKNKKAWELIKESVPSNTNFGDASISPKHYNFFVNNNKATFEEMNSLIKYVKKNVKDKTGIKINLEIKIIE